ncbi:DUF732 domain-containing protein [Yinghuangia seranimata]|uniref:DUF732 domain-containing protein n=1 Tax=Yinghuangia seranimata TaxID=408067 RepID=UPI00248B090C|nr:DUF732 domain-containing protein [Yinghuangia seranimata]MDI2128614.1 DUF732 domain-containing protein [Yinghuangia seranimata]
MHRRSCAASLVLVLTLPIAACASADADGRRPTASDGSAPGTSAAQGSSAPPGGQPPGLVATPVPTSPGGLPPAPDPATRARYIAALEAIDPRLVGSDQERAVELGREACQSIGVNLGHAKLVSQTRQKFSRNGLSVTTAQAEAVLRAANTHLCPLFGA